MFREIRFMVAGRFVTRRGEEGRMERENSFLSRPLINPLSSGPPYTLDGAHVPRRTELVIHQPLLSHNGVFFFSSKNSSPAKRRKYFKISLYKILCNNIGVVRMALNISNKLLFLFCSFLLLFFFFEITLFFPNCLINCFKCVKKILFSHACIVYIRYIRGKQECAN